VEAFTVLLGRNPQQTLERTAHGFRAAEAAFFGDEFNGLRRLFEPAPRSFDADLGHESRGRHAGLLGEDAREIALAHSNPLGHLLDGQRFTQVVKDPDLQFAQRRAVRSL
jgi:hypothetical protein